MNARTLSIQAGIRSEMLSHLRKIEWIDELFGSIAQFNIVIDANIILGDLIWLVSKRKKPDAVTELMECIQAGTIIAYVSRSVFNEVNEHIPKIADKKGLSEQMLRQEWKKYRKLIKVRTPRKALVDRYKGGQDPDDAPTLALERMLRADGILSKDSDIVAMGGIVIESDFTRQARDYSRKTAVVATIHFSGGIALSVSLAAIEAALKSVKNFIALFRGLPVPVQMVIFIAIIMIATNPKARSRVVGLVGQNASAISEYYPMAKDFLALVFTTLAESSVTPPVPKRAPRNHGSTNTQEQT